MKMQGGSEGSSEQPGESASAGTHAFAAPSSTETGSTEASSDPNDFRTRFHRQLVAPSPFTVAGSAAAGTANSASVSASASTAGAVSSETVQQQLQQAAQLVTLTAPTSIDPRLATRLPLHTEFAEMVAKMAAAAAAAAAATPAQPVPGDSESGEGGKQQEQGEEHRQVNGSGAGEAEVLIDGDADEGAEVEKELAEGEHQTNGHTA